MLIALWGHPRGTLRLPSFAHRGLGRGKGMDYVNILQESDLCGYIRHLFNFRKNTRFTWLAVGEVQVQNQAAPFVRPWMRAE